MCFISNKSQSLQIKRFLKTSHINALQTCLKNGFVHRISNWKINSKNNCRNIRAKFLAVQSCSGPIFVSVGVIYQRFKMPCHHQKEEVLFQPKNRGGLNGFSFEFLESLYFCLNCFLFYPKFLCSLVKRQFNQIRHFVNLLNCNGQRW